MRRKFDLSVYFVADQSLCGGRHVSGVVESAIKGGVTFVQYRDKTSTLDNMEAYARSVLKVCRGANIPCVINDHVKMAIKIGADGVHIGQGDMDPVIARKALGEDAIIGMTAFNEEQLSAVSVALVDYVGTGPVYETQTDKGKPVIGPVGIGWLKEFTTLPMVGIGGITPETAGAVIEAGADGVAVMRAIGQASNPDQVAAALKHVVEQARAA